MEHRSETVDSVRDGILRWLSRSENSDWKAAFTRNQEWQFYQQGLDEMLYFDMGIRWLGNSGWGKAHGSGEIVALWDEALLEVTNLLCPGAE